MDATLSTGDTIGLLAMDLAIVFAVLLLARLLYGIVSGVDTMRGLADRGNFAIGISLAGATAGVAVMLGGVLSGGLARGYGAEAGLVAAYGAAGLALMWVTRLIFDRIALPRFSVGDEIAGGNVPVAVVDAGNMMATAIMLRAVIVWSDDALVPGLIAVALGYAASQIILTLTAYYRIWLFGRRNRGARFDAAVQGGNAALALRFVGFQVGVALAVTAASGVAPYDAGGDPLLQAAIWGAVSAAAALALALLGLIAERCVLTGIDLSEEVDRQGNPGVALTEAAVYVAIGFLLLSHLA